MSFLKEQTEKDLKAWRGKLIYPIGLIIKNKKDSNTVAVNLIAIYGSTVKSFPIEKIEYAESAFGASYNYMSGYDVTKYAYELGESARYNFLSIRNQEILFHYKWNAGLKATCANKLFTSIISAMKGDFEESIIKDGTWNKTSAYNGTVINLLIDNETRKKEDISFLIETKESHVSVHPDNLPEAELLLIENLHQYKVWGEK